MDQLLRAIEQRVAELIDREPALLLSYLYRLDVEERKVRELMNSPHVDNKIRKISELILARQLKRVETKRNLKQDPIDGWDW